VAQQALPAYFMRGGTSKALMLLRADLPAEQSQWAPIFLAMMGSPDQYGRQLNGMGGGISSLSKVCVIGPSTHPEADVDYTFAQVAVREAHVDYRGNCGNMSAAVGPFAVHKGLVAAQEGETTVKIHNTNTGKIIESRFEVRDGVPIYSGSLTIPGVDGSGAPIELRFLQPGGATTGQLLPTGAASDTLVVEGLGELTVSMVDAANAAVFVPAEALGLTGTELPDQLESDQALMENLERIRRAASVKMGITNSLEAAAQVRAVPFVGLVAAPQDSPTLGGSIMPAGELNLVARVISNGQPHRALPLTISLCLAVAAKIDGTIVYQLAQPSQDIIRLGNPSGVLEVQAKISQQDGKGWDAEYGSFYRTARLLMSGEVWFAKTKTT